MFGTLGGPELFLIFVVALIVFGPRKLPDIGKSLGKMMAEFRRASNDFRSTIENEVETEKIRESMRIEPPRVDPVRTSAKTGDGAEDKKKPAGAEGAGGTEASAESGDASEDTGTADSKKAGSTTTDAAPEPPSGDKAPEPAPGLADRGAGQRSAQADGSAKEPAAADRGAGQRSAQGDGGAEEPSPADRSVERRSAQGDGGAEEPSPVPTTVSREPSSSAPESK